MLRKLAAAVIAASLIAGPAMAQGTNQGTVQTTTKMPAATSQPAVKADVKVKTTEMRVTKTKKHVAMIQHHRKHFAQVKHVKTAKHGLHVKHLKQVRQTAKSKIAG
jgi:hypothetical protein